MSLSIGEKVECVIAARRNGTHGQYLGCKVGLWGIAKVEGMTFEVGRAMEVAVGAEILHCESGLRACFSSRWDIPCVIDQMVCSIRGAI